MRKLLRGPLAIVFCLTLFCLFVPRAQATEVNFNCSPFSQCSMGNPGTITFDGTSNFSSTGITLFNTQGPFSSNTAFTLTFNTATGNISVTDGSDTLTGTIQSFTVSGGPQFDVAMHVNWNSLPSSVVAFLGTPTGLNSTIIQFSAAFQNNGMSQTQNVSQVILGILPTPEPVSVALFGSGLIMLGGILRRRSRK